MSRDIWRIVGRGARKQSTPQNGARVSHSCSTNEDHVDEDVEPTAKVVSSSSRADAKKSMSRSKVGENVCAVVDRLVMVEGCRWFAEV